MAKDSKDTLIYRLKEYLFVKGLSMAELERTAGLTEGYLRNSKGAFNSDRLTQILLACPDLDGNWLLSGLGSMYRPECEPEDGVQPPSHHYDARHSRAVNQNMGGNQYNIRGIGRGSSIFDGCTSLTVIESIDVESVPEKHRSLVMEIQARKKEIDHLKSEVERLRVEKEAAMKDANDVKDTLIKYLIEAKNNS